jgi:predicted ester cyclase
MSEEGNKAIIRRLYQELDKKNFGIYSELCSFSFISHFPGSPKSQSKKEREQISRIFYEAIPNLRHSIDDLISDGDKVAARLTARGTHTGSFRGMQPTGNEILFTGMRFYLVFGGKITEEWATFDSLLLMQQLGVIPLS